MNQIEEIIAAQPSSCRIPCPQCSQDRKKSHLKTLSITVNESETLYDCHHCGLAGCIPTGSYLAKYTQIQRTAPKKVFTIPTQLAQDDYQIKQFFLSRGITLDDLSELPQMTTDSKWFYGANQLLPAIGFIYGGRHQPEAIKWRSLEGKNFTQTGAARSFYGIERISTEDETLVIVEGEADVIALASIGIKAVSCPNGAPMKVSDGKVVPEDDVKFSFVWEARSTLKRVTTIILATDADEAGNALAEELARRCDRAKCKRVHFPSGSKDPTDVIRDYGASFMRELIDNAQPLPLKGVYNASEYAHEVFETYREGGRGSGLSTGLKKVDELFTLKGGLMTVCTGQPSMGKSEFWDQIMVNMSTNHAWKWAVASFENAPSEHISKMAEKIVGKPYFEGDTPRMNEQELRGALDFINDHFVFLQSRDDTLSSVDSIIDRTKQAIMRLGVRGLIIDPYNYIDRPHNIKENDFINDMLTRLLAFAKAYDIHVVFIAHPAKMYPRDDGTYAVPNGNHISGSAAWFSKPDIGMTVHRSKAGVEIHVWKCRHKWIGKQGIAVIDYHVPTGRYFDAKTIQWGGGASPKADTSFNDFNDDDLPF